MLFVDVQKKQKKNTKQTLELFVFTYIFGDGKNIENHTPN